MARKKKDKSLSEQTGKMVEEALDRLKKAKLSPDELRAATTAAREATKAAEDLIARKEADAKEALSGALRSFPGKGLIFLGRGVLGADCSGADCAFACSIGCIAGCAITGGLTVGFGAAGGTAGGSGTVIATTPKVGSFIFE